MKPKRQPNIPLKRQIGIMQNAAELRKQLFGPNEPINPERALDHLTDTVQGFDWFVGDNFFQGMNNVLAYAKFDNGRQIFLSEKLYDDLGKYGEITYKSASFVVAHEIGHALLHHRTRKAFARHKLGSPENYSVESKKEKEANLFAGSFVVPTTIIDPDLSDVTISRLYQVNYSAASSSKREAAIYRRWATQNKDGGPK